MQGVSDDSRIAQLGVTGKFEQELEQCRVFQMFHELPSGVELENLNRSWNTYCTLQPTLG